MSVLLANCSKTSAPIIRDCNLANSPLILSGKVILGMAPDERHKLWIKNVYACVICGDSSEEIKKICDKYSKLYSSDL